MPTRQWSNARAEDYIQETEPDPADQVELNEEEEIVRLTAESYADKARAERQHRAWEKAGCPK